MSFVKLENLNDFIQPSSACIKPIEKPAPGVVAKVKDVNLSDCLACSGCITSAESVLVQRQNYDELFRVINDNKISRVSRDIVVSLSLQSVSSLAYKYGLSSQEAAERLASFLVSLGCSKVYDINIARHISLVESYKEFHERRKTKVGLPVISSICPGWICYAEKTNGDLIIPHLSKVRSPQQIMGALIKNSLLKGKKRADIYHLTLMPCFDKKLEASRQDFTDSNDETRDVDCVLTPIEIEEILNDEGVELLDFEPRKLDCLTQTGIAFDQPLTNHFGSASGGYAENILLTEASRLNNNSCNDGRAELSFSTSRNNDFIEVNLANDSATSAGLGKFAIVNGFRNIQTVVQRLKRKALKYDYIEIMACPSGCINGGAQCKPNPGDDQAAIIKRAKQLYHEVEPLDLPISGEENNARLYDKLNLDQNHRDQLLYTSFHPVPKMQNLTVNW